MLQFLLQLQIVSTCKACSAIPKFCCIAIIPISTTSESQSEPHILLVSSELRPWSNHWHHCRLLYPSWDLQLLHCSSGVILRYSMSRAFLCYSNSRFETIKVKLLPKVHAATNSSPHILICNYHIPGQAAPMPSNLLCRPAAKPSGPILPSFSHSLIIFTRFLLWTAKTEGTCPHLRANH